MRLIDAIDGLIDTYNSIDVRTVVVKGNNSWQSIITIIRLRHETVDDLREEHQKLIKKCSGLIKTDDFQVGLFQLPIEKWSKIRLDLEQKSLCIADDFAVNFESAIDLNYTTDARYNPSEDYVNTEWQSYLGKIRISAPSVPFERSKYSDLVIKHTFSSLEDYLAAILQIHRNETSQHSVIITAPIFFKVLDVKFDVDTITVSYQGYPQKNIKLALNFYRADSYQNSFDLIDKIIKPIEIGNNLKEITNDGVTTHIDTKSMGNQFEVIVTKNDSIVLYEQGKSDIKEKWLTRTNITNPIFPVFNNFVSVEELEKMFFEHKGRGKTNPKIVFEQAVSWLLSLLGFNAILLGQEYEKSGSGSNEISYDILGSSSKNLILLVNATTGLPKQFDFDRERDYRNRLSKTLQNPDVIIKSIYFTGRDTTEANDSAKANEISFIDNNKLKIILDMMKRGDVDKARNTIIDENDFGLPL